MQAKVGLTVNVEMIRDGGSFAASFVDVEGNRYVLFFPVKPWRQVGECIAPAEHLAPVIIDGDPSKRPADHSELAGPATPVSWQAARDLLSQIAANKPREDDPRRSPLFEDWLQQMTAVAERDGAPIEGGEWRQVLRLQ